MIIIVNDLRLHGNCAIGQRAFFKAHGFDAKDVFKNGIDHEKLIATGDSMAINAVEKILAEKALEV